MCPSGTPCVCGKQSPLSLCGQCALCRSRGRARGAIAVCIAPVFSPSVALRVSPDLWQQLTSHISLGRHCPEQDAVGRRAVFGGGAAAQGTLEEICARFQGLLSGRGKSGATLLPCCRICRCFQCPFKGALGAPKPPCSVQLSAFEGDTNSECKPTIFLW